MIKNKKVLKLAILAGIISMITVIKANADVTKTNDIEVEEIKSSEQRNSDIISDLAKKKEDLEKKEKSVYIGGNSSPTKVIIDPATGDYYIKKTPEDLKRIENGLKSLQEKDVKKNMEYEEESFFNKLFKSNSNESDKYITFNAKLPSVSIDKKGVRYTLDIYSDRARKNNIIKNNSDFDLSLSKDNSIDIEFIYEKYKHEPHPHFLTRFEGNSKLNQSHYYPYGDDLTIKVSFFQWDTKFPKDINFPEKLIIKGENIRGNFICDKIKSNFVHSGESYSLEYNCPEVPNVNDMQGKMEIRFLK